MPSADSAGSVASMPSEHQPRRRLPRIVALGGGSGLPALLLGLKRAYFATPSIDAAADASLLTAIVTMADDGGSSGRLRRRYQVPPPGDIRNCLLALADADPRVLALFDFRFSGHGDVGGHSLGNLILTALGDASALPAAVRAIDAADAVVIAPGSLYTSLIAILLVQDIAAALTRRRVPIIMVMNLMTEPGETDGYTAVDHILAVRRHAPDIALRDVLLQAHPIPPELASDYASRGSVFVYQDRTLLAAMGFRTIEADMLATGPKVRHDPDKLAAAVVRCALEGM